MSNDSTAAPRARFGDPVRHLEEVDSTNAEALRWAEEPDPPPEGAVVLADRQTQGRGRWDRTWISTPRGSLVLSLVLRPSWTDERLGLLTIAAGVACADAFEDLGLRPCRLKWPNDVLLDHGKVAGILIETRLRQGQPLVAVVGIGVNLADLEDLPDEIAARAGSLARAATVRGIAPPARPEVLGRIVARLESVYRGLHEPEGAGELLLRARAKMEMIGSDVVVRTPTGDRIEGVAEDIAPDGSLRLRTRTGTMHVHAAEIETLRPR